MKKTIKDVIDQLTEFLDYKGIANLNMADDSILPETFVTNLKEELNDVLHKSNNDKLKKWSDDLVLIKVALRLRKLKNTNHRLLIDFIKQKMAFSFVEMGRQQAILDRYRTQKPHDRIVTTQSIHHKITSYFDRIMDVGYTSRTLSPLPVIIPDSFPSALDLDSYKANIKEAYENNRPLEYEDEYANFLPNEQLYAPYVISGYLFPTLYRASKNEDGLREQFDIDFIDAFSEILNQEEINFIKEIYPEVIELINEIKENGLTLDFFDEMSSESRELMDLRSKLEKKFRERKNPISNNQPLVDLVKSFDDVETIKEAKAEARRRKLAKLVSRRLKEKGKPIKKGGWANNKNKHGKRNSF